MISHNKDNKKYLLFLKPFKMAGLFLALLFIENKASSVKTILISNTIY